MVIKNQMSGSCYPILLSALEDEPGDTGGVPERAGHGASSQGPSFLRVAGALTPASEGVAAVVRHFEERVLPLRIQLTIEVVDQLISFFLPPSMREKEALKERKAKEAFRRHSRASVATASVRMFASDAMPADAGRKAADGGSVKR